MNAAMERLLRRVAALALCFGLLWCLISPFIIPIHALCQPGGTDVTTPAINNSALLPVVLWCLGWPIVLARQTVKPVLQFCWTLGCVLLLLHMAVAFHLGHGWSHQGAWEHTRQVGGYGDGIFVNYAFALVWLADVVWVWAAPTSYVRRPAWLNWTTHGFLAIVVFNAAVVFGSWELRVLFAVAFLTNCSLSRSGWWPVAPPPPAIPNKPAAVMNPGADEPLAGRSPLDDRNRR